MVHPVRVPPAPMMDVPPTGMHAMAIPPTSVVHIAATTGAHGVPTTTVSVAAGVMAHVATAAIAARAVHPGAVPHVPAPTVAVWPIGAGAVVPARARAIPSRASASVLTNARAVPPHRPHAMAVIAAAVTASCHVLSPTCRLATRVVGGAEGFPSGREARAGPGQAFLSVLDAGAIHSGPDGLGGRAQSSPGGGVMGSPASGRIPTASIGSIHEV